MRKLTIAIFKRKENKYPYKLYQRNIINETEWSMNVIFILPTLTCSSKHKYKHILMYKDANIVVGILVYVKFI